MKTCLSFMVAFLICGLLNAAELQWGTNFGQALAQAKQENKLVLMNYTGSDWCSWCKKLKEDVFTKPEFVEYANKNLVLVEVDFPHAKPQAESLKKANQTLSERYGVEAYPTLIAVNASGKEVWRSAGYMKGGPAAYIQKLDAAKAKK